jgi:hypothetical protein
MSCPSQPAEIYKFYPIFLLEKLIESKVHYLIKKSSTLVPVLKQINYSTPGEISWYIKSIWAGRSGDRIPVEARFSAPFYTVPGAHPASCKICSGSLSRA